MGYQCPRIARERIMLFGEAGVGKTDAILSVAKRLPDVRFRIVECDWTSSADRLMDAERFAGVTNVETRQVFPDEWKDQLEAAEWLRDETGPDDFAAFDSATHSWSAVQEWFIDQTFPGDAEDYWIQKRVEHDGKGRDFGGWEDWPYMKKEHTKLYKAFARIKGHLIITAEAAKLGESEKKDDQQLFGMLGSRPAGRKQMAHVPATVVHLRRDMAGQRYMQVPKDRGRELTTSEVEMSDFFRDYLIQRAGWKVG